MYFRSSNNITREENPRGETISASGFGPPGGPNPLADMGRGGPNPPGGTISTGDQIRWDTGLATVRLFNNIDRTLCALRSVKTHVLSEHKI